MPKQLTSRVRFKKISVKALISQIDSIEPAYPVYRFSNAIKFERPETPGTTYRRHR